MASCLLVAVEAEAQVDPKVIKARKKAEKERQKAEKKAMREKLAQSLNEQYYGISAPDDEPAKPEKAAKEKKSNTKPKKETTAPKKADSKKEQVSGSVVKPERQVTTTPSPANTSIPSIVSTCKYLYNTVDEFTGKQKIGTENHHLFSYTEESLRKFMKNKEFLTCNGYISRIAGMTALNLEFILDSPYAKQEYGPIQAGSSLIIKLINGETVTLESTQFDPGKIIQQKSKTYYSTSYLISAKMEKELRKAEVDKIRMVWGVGYVDYEIYELDFFIDLFNCLDAAM